MRVTKIDLHNFRAAKDLSIDLHPKMNLIVGVNGTGKSTILQALVYSLIVLIRKINNSGNEHPLIRGSDINTKSDTAFIKIETQYNEKKYKWNIRRNRPGVNRDETISTKEVVDLSIIIKDDYKAKSKLPVIVYYPVNRIVDDSAMLQISLERNLDSLGVYENALDGKPNFQNFFKWFREQDDYVNQRLMSRTNWIKRKTPELKKRITQIFNKVENTSHLNQNDEYFLSEKGRNDLEFIVHEPRFLFRVMSQMLGHNSEKQLRPSVVGELIHEIDFMVSKMDMLAIEGSDSVVNTYGNLLEILSEVLTLVAEIRVEQDNNNEVSEIIWPMFVLAFDLALWWLSDEGHSRLTNELTSISWPTRNFAMSESESNELKSKIVNIVSGIIESDIKKYLIIQNKFDREIQSVTRAVASFIPGYSNLRINRNADGSSQMLVDKNGQEFDIEQLSDGEKNLIALIGDIARRLSIGNPRSDDPLKESGIVIIDELDLHLHPKWQRIIAEKITEVFPNCQFIISTHSPQVISHIRPESILILKNENGEIAKSYVNDSYGKNSDRILEDIMDETARPKYVDDEIKFIFRLVSDGKLIEAQSRISKLRADIGEDGDLIKAGVLIRRREIIGK